MQTAAGPYKTSLYDLRVAVLVDKTKEWSKPMSVESPCIHSLGGEFDAILGRDVLGNGDLKLERSGDYLFVL